jgi:hypothetical protein
MNFLNLFCPSYPKHGRIWDLGQDTFYCSHQQHDEEGKQNLWTAQELIAAHAPSVKEEEETHFGFLGSPTKTKSS